jgi:hypothetical protein
MKTKMKITFIASFFLILVGCSAISELHYLYVDSANVGWQKINQRDSTEYYIFEWDEFYFYGENITIRVEPKIDLVWHHRATSIYGNWSWVGPTPLPIIPLWLDPKYDEKSAKDGNLQVDIFISSVESSSTIRLFDTKVIYCDTDSALKPLIKSAIKVSPKEQCDIIDLSSDEQHFTIEFDLAYLNIFKSIDSLTFEFPNVQNVRGSETIPRIVFKKEHDTTYLPFIFGG